MTFSQAVQRGLLAFVGFVVIQIITGMLRSLPACWFR
jgi:hypothetical protein